MAYTKTEWKSRSGSKLNKFTKSEESLESVVLTNTPDSVIEPGTPFSAENMNNIEEGIAEAHSRVAIVENKITAEEAARAEADALAVQKAGDTMTGALHILDAVNDDEPVAKGQFDTGIENTRAYTDQKIAAAVSGDVIGFFEYGRASTATAFPVTASEGAAAFDFEANTEYTFTSGAWNAASAPVTVQDKAEIIVAEMLDGTDRSGNPMAGEKAAALYLEAGAAWQFLIDRGQAPDGETIRRRASDGALETFGVIADNPGSDALPAAGEKQGAFGTLQTLRDNIKKAYEIIEGSSHNQTIVYPSYDGFQNLASLFSGTTGNYNATWTATLDCFAYVQCNNAYTIIINGITSYQAIAQTSNYFFLKAGDVISANSATNQNSNNGIYYSHIAKSYVAPQGITQARPVSYSLIEQDTGQNWIDGKPIYQKTVIFSLEMPIGQNNIGISNTITPGTTALIKAEILSNGNTPKQNMFVLLDSNIYYVINASNVNWTLRDWVITFWYTK